MYKYQVVLTAEDGEYIKREYSTKDEAVTYVILNQNRYGEGQELFVRKVWVG